MSELKYIWFWEDTDNWFLTFGFHVYTEKQVTEYTKKNQNVKFTKLGVESDFTDLSWNMYLKMNYDIINENRYRDNNEVYESHHHTLVLSTILPSQVHKASSSTDSADQSSLTI